MKIISIKIKCYKSEYLGTENYRGYFVSNEDIKIDMELNWSAVPGEEYEIFINGKVGGEIGKHLNTINSINIDKISLT